MIQFSSWFQESILVTHITISTNTEIPNSASDTTLELEDARKSLGTQPIEMADEELTYTKEAKQKRAANVVQQEFAQSKHRQDPPQEQKNKPVSAASQQATSHYHYGRLAVGKTCLLKKRNQPTERKVKKPHPLQHQWKVRRHHITTC